MKRYEAIQIIGKSFTKNTLAVSTTGFISREFFASSDRPQNFYMIGSMGLATPVAIGIALTTPEKRVVSLEGDGSMLMNLGVMPMPAVFGAKNLIVVVLDNESYGSTGGQPTISSEVQLEKIAKASGFRRVRKVNKKNDLEKCIKEMINKNGPLFLLVKVDQGELKDVGRITLSPEEIKERFQRYQSH